MIKKYLNRKKWTADWSEHYIVDPDATCPMQRWCVVDIHNTVLTRTALKVLRFRLFLREKKNDTFGGLWVAFSFSSTI